MKNTGKNLLGILRKTRALVIIVAKKEFRGGIARNAL